MIRRRKLVILSAIILLLFVITTNYLLIVLTDSESEVRKAVNVEDEIYGQLRQLPEQYKIPQSTNDNLVDKFIRTVNSGGRVSSFHDLWAIANSWVSKTRIVDLESPHLGDLLWGLKRAPIKRADLDGRGTQLKLLLTLEGNQDVVFKPQWYSKERIIEGPVYAGKDRFASEVIAFYLSAILNIPFTPASVARSISLSRDVVPVATKRLLNTTFEHANRTCVYGKCFYCRREDPVCEDGNFSLSGAVIFNVGSPQFKSHRSPWQRTYKKDRKALWEQSNNYCKFVREKLTKRRILDLIDTAIFDFFLQNGDRHHYETMYDNVVLLDNGKGFGNPNVHHLDILAPLYQCCLLRSRTWKRLLGLTGGSLRRHLESMPDVLNLITHAHLNAIEERLLIVFATVEYCRNRNKAGDSVFF